jgi:hypothetical protein
MARNAFVVVLTVDFRDFPQSVGCSTDVSGYQDYGLKGSDAV